MVLAPSERAIVDVLFHTPGEVPFEHRTPDQVYTLGEFTAAGTAVGDAARTFDALRTDPALSAARRSLAHGMVPTNARETHHGPVPGDDPGDGIEWEDLMPEINRQTDATNMIWKARRPPDRGRERVHHLGFHGGRPGEDPTRQPDGGVGAPDAPPVPRPRRRTVLVLSRQAGAGGQLVWKDSVLEPAAPTVDILLDVSNPGRWMAHCHIAEHNQAGMMFSFDVSPRASEASTTAPDLGA